MMRLRRYLLFIVAALSVSGGVVAKSLNVLNWSDYIAEETLPVFEKRTGIDVTYDVFDSNEVLEAKLLSGRSGYDVVAPTSEFLSRQLRAGAFVKLDKSKIPNWKNLDSKLLDKLQEHDPDNQYAVPYMWGTTGIGYNKAKIEKILGREAPVNSWELLFNPDYMKKLAPHGVAFLESPTEVFAAALTYLGLDPNSKNPKDYEQAEKLISQVRPYVTYFNSSRYISDLANGDIVVAMGWSGDILMASDRAEEAGNGNVIEYSIPKEGAGVWFDMLAIPVGAANTEEAHAFLNYLLEPKVIAEITNYVSYANPNTQSTPFLDESIAKNPGIYPDKETASRLYAFKEVEPKLDRVITRAWNRLMSGK
ncbi:polyamine ABC transporter substrate-binding protein [Sansalvadorimonas sp. 2012CJ34-2]|uniref:Putrescine-binding periplasmic protein n=1 Tax=Parendozoicomonas callyspongiae TaxID=2942213 RepID=A0ABT0PEN0_9GAMM|nr:polyamine ABC transporter substrate-binding protein [Sansalvadorimonas sp. 2012CJ34-2]MCL6269770.1 polyamine ABC transporter substrate-binding protein [Sansalvadorimonas sp. 2012CJ34-2]